MKIKFWIMAMTLAAATSARAATNDLTTLLQKGLFDEEANRDLNAAIADYQSVANAFDKDRQLAATAIFRLGEVYRKLGKTNEAAVQYQRIIKEFSDQPTLVTLSRQNLAGMGVSNSSETASGSVSDQTEQARKSGEVSALQSQYALLSAQLEQARKETNNEIVAEMFSDNKELADRLRMEMAMIPPHESMLADAKAKNPAGTAENERLLKEARARVEAARQQIFNFQEIRLKALESAIRNARAGTIASGQGEITSTTDEEQQEIRRIQLLIQNSPDLINAPGQGVNGEETPLAMAAAKGQLVVAKYLLDHGADVNGWSRQRTQTPLFNAAEYGHKAMVELLLSRGADVSGGGLNPLFVAASRGYVSVAEVLLNSKADVNLPSGTEGGMRPVHVAARDGRTEMLQLLINHGADVSVTNAQGDSPLALAAGKNEMAAAKMLLAAKANVNAKDKDGNTPLHDAAYAGHAEMVSQLLNSGAAVDPVNGINATPLVQAVANGKVDATRVLLEHKADPNHRGWNRGAPQFNWQPITFALNLGNNDLVKLLLDAGANPEGDSVDPHQSDPLFIAMDKNNVDAVQLLLQHGANPNRTSESGQTPLEFVLYGNRDKRMIPLLLDKGADPNPQRTDHAPIFATQDPEIGRLLIKDKADVNIRRYDGSTRLMFAENTNFLELLLENGAKTDLQDTNGNTALHWAVYLSRTNSIAILLAHKANPNIQNDNGLTPLDLAKEGMGGHIVGSHLYPPSTETRGMVLAVQSKIADMLRDAGGLANLPKRDRIEVRREGSGSKALSKSAHGWNRYSLLEAVAAGYGLITQSDSGGAETGSRRELRQNLFNPDFRFPDFKNVIIHRRADASAKQTEMKVNMEDILKAGDCSRDVWLEWGDMIEIPEADHPVDQLWRGLTDEQVSTFTNCLSRRVTVKIKGEDTLLALGPQFAQTQYMRNAFEHDYSLTPASFMLRYVLANSKLVRVSSDLSRVKVTRVDPQTRKKQEWVIDCTDPKQSDLWVRDGDVIEVPEK